MSTKALGLFSKAFSHFCLQSWCECLPAVVGSDELEQTISSPPKQQKLSPSQSPKP
jgi:hypothetical protein